MFREYRDSVFYRAARPPRHLARRQSGSGRNAQSSERILRARYRASRRWLACRCTDRDPAGARRHRRVATARPSARGVVEAGIAACLDCTPSPALRPGACRGGGRHGQGCHCPYCFTEGNPLGNRTGVTLERLRRGARLAASGKVRGVEAVAARSRRRVRGGLPVPARRIRERIISCCAANRARYRGRRSCRTSSQTPRRAARPSDPAAGNAARYPQ